jgi:hypothetical protein
VTGKRVKALCEVSALTALSAVKTLGILGVSRNAYGASEELTMAFPP